MSVPLSKALRDPALIPLSPHAGQEALIDLAEGHRFLFAACGRRFGKSRFAAAVALRDLLLEPEADRLVQPGETRRAVVVSTSREQSTIILEHARSLLLASPTLRDQLIEERENELRFRGNRALLAVPCNARSIRGLAVSTAIFDEMAHHVTEEEGPRAAERLWGALTPSIAQFGRFGRVIAISTPAGTSGLFATLYEKARSGELAEAAAYHAPSSANPLLDPAYLQAQESALGASDFAREFGAVFTAGGGQFLDMDLLRDCVGSWREVAPRDATHWLAAFDPAFSQDPAALVVVGRRREDSKVLVCGYTARWLPPPKRRRIVRSRKAETSHISRVCGEVAAVLKRYHLHRLVSDQHLPGTVTSEFQRHGIRVAVRAWTTESRIAAFRSLRALVGTNRIELPDDPQLLAELGRIRTKPGRDAIETPRVADSHCDLALSLAAACLEHEKRPPAQRARGGSILLARGSGRRRSGGAEILPAADGRLAREHQEAFDR